MKTFSSPIFRYTNKRTWHFYFFKLKTSNNDSTDCDDLNVIQSVNYTYCNYVKF